MILDSLLGMMLLALTFFYSYNKEKSKKTVKKEPLNKGKKGEEAVNQKIKKCFSRHSYFLINNVTLNTKDGGTTQIDHILVSEYGVFIIETKNYSGWIFGGKNNKEWTQSFPKKKYKFQNPIHQNQKHINELAILFDMFDKRIFKSVIVFTGQSKFKSKNIKNVINIDELQSYIESFQKKELSKNKLYFIVGKIDVFRKPVCEMTDDLHRFYLKEKINKSNDLSINKDQAAIE